MNTPVLTSALTSNLNFFISENRLWGTDAAIVEILKNPPLEWQKNLDEFFSLRQDFYKEHISATSQEKNMPSAPVLTIEKNSHWYHSRRNTQKEAERTLDFLKKNEARHLVAVGSGLGHIPYSALQQKTVESVFLIEPDTEMLFYILSLHNWQEKNIYILHKENLSSKGLDHLLNFLRGKNISAVQIYFHKPCLLAYPELYRQYQTRLPELLQTRHVNQNTLIKFQEIWNRNIFLNLPFVLQGSTLTNLINIMTPLVQEFPVVIAGAGPSLLESIPQLKKYRKQFLLVAADTAFIPLAKHGIYPDIALSVDPQWLNHHFLTHKNINKSLWLLDPAVCYANTKLLTRNNAITYWWDNPFYADELIRKQCGSRGHIAHGGSVSTNAFDLALQAQSKEIVLVGQDLSYPTLTAHVKGSVLEAAVFLQNNRFVTMENHNHKQMHSFSPLYVPRIDRKKNILSSDKMNVFIKWFEEKANGISAKTRLINASAQGVYLQGFEHLNLENFFKEKHPPPTSLSPLLFPKKLQENTDKKSDCQKNLHKLFEKIQLESERLHKAYKENFLLSEKISRLLRQNKKPTPEQLQVLSTNDNLNRKHAETAKIISLGAQKSILDITEGEESDPYTSGALFYRELMKSAFFISSLARKTNTLLSTQNTEQK